MQVDVLLKIMDFLEEYTDGYSLVIRRNRMKAIIVIDLNDTTLNEWDTDTPKCWAEIKVYTPIKGGAHGIGCVYANNNVELKPLPKRKFEIRILKKGHYEEAKYIKGYNDCLNEILGETDDRDI